MKVNSHIGQQLSADIELVDLTAADLAEVQARLANPDVFKGAGLDVPPVLGGMNIAIARRENKRFLHLTTLQPVNADVLHIFLELSSGGRQAIRAASLWLTPEQRTERTSAARPASAEPAPVAVAAAPSPAPIVAASSPSPTAISAKTSSLQSAEAAMNEAAQRAFAYRRQKALEQAQATAAGQAPQPATTSSMPPAAAPATPIVASKPPATALPAASPAPVAARRIPAPPQACAQEKQVEAQLQQCQAMSSKLADIEGKVSRLQTAMAGPAKAAPIATAAPATSAAAAKSEPAAIKPTVAPAKPSSAPVKPGATPVKPGVAADLAGNSRRRLYMILGGVLAGLAALGGMIYVLRKRQAKGPLKIWQSFRKKGDAEVLEAAPEEAEQLAAQ